MRHLSIGIISLTVIFLSCAEKNQPEHVQPNTKPEGVHSKTNSPQTNSPPNPVATKDKLNLLEAECSVFFKNDDISLLEKAVNMGRNIQEPCSSYNETFLHFAALKGRIKAVNYLLGKKASLEVRDQWGKTPLLSAAKFGSVSIMKQLVQLGAKIKERDKEGNNALHYAVLSDNTEAVDYLLEQGFDIDEAAGSECEVVAEQCGWTPLVNAIYAGSIKMITFLLEKKADIGPKSKSAQYGFFVAIYELQKRDKPSPSGEKPKHLRVIEKLIKLGLDVNGRHPDDSTTTVLEFAIYRCLPDVAELLMKNGARIRKSELKGMYQNVLKSYAYARCLDIETATFLIDHGMPPNSENEMGGSLLSQYIEHGSPKEIDYLVNKGANIKWRNEDGDSYLALAIKEGNIELARYFVEKGISVNSTDGEGSPLLFMAIEKNMGRSYYREKALLELGADPNVRDKDGKHILIFAIERSASEVVTKLIENGADVNVKDKDGVAAVFLAREENNLSPTVLKAMLDHGLTVDVKNKEGQTLYEIEAEDPHGKKEILKLLSEYKTRAVDKT